MRQLRIGIDLDGVIANTPKLKSLTARHLLGQEIHCSRFTREIVVPNGWLTEKEYDKVSSHACGSWRFGQMLEPIKWAKFYLRVFQKEGHDLLIVTSRTGKMFDVANQWLKKEALNFIPAIGVGYKNSKAPILEEWGADIFIDDDLKKLLPCIGKVKHLYLFSWPWNEDKELSKELPAEIKGIENAWNKSPWKQIYLEVSRIKNKNLEEVEILT